MLPRPNRLAREADYRRSYRAGRSATIGGLRVWVNRRPGQITRIGIVVSTKVSRRATVRNRLRRQIRSAARAVLAARPTGFDIVVAAQPPRPAQPTADPRTAMSQLIERLPINQAPPRARP